MPFVSTTVPGEPKIYCEPSNTHCISLTCLIAISLSPGEAKADIWHTQSVQMTPRVQGKMYVRVRAGVKLLCRVMSCPFSWWFGALCPLKIVTIIYLTLSYAPIMYNNMRLCRMKLRSKCECSIIESRSSINSRRRI